MRGDAAGDSGVRVWGVWRASIDWRDARVAHGDLDCDGVYATFESFGNQDENGAWDPRWRPDGKFGGFIRRELE